MCIKKYRHSCRHTATHTRTTINAKQAPLDTGRILAFFLYLYTQWLKNRAVFHDLAFSPCYIIINTHKTDQRFSFQRTFLAYTFHKRAFYSF